MEILMIDNVLYHENMKKYQIPIINQNKKINTMSSGKKNAKSAASVKKIIKDAVK
jgi:hypothetical protein